MTEGLPEEEEVGRKELLPGGSLPRVEVEVSKSVDAWSDGVRRYAAMECVLDEWNSRSSCRSV